MIRLNIEKESSKGSDSEPGLDREVGCWEGRDKFIVVNTSFFIVLVQKCEVPG